MKYSIEIILIIFLLPFCWSFSLIKTLQSDVKIAEACSKDLEKYLNENNSNNLSEKKRMEMAAIINKVRIKSIQKCLELLRERSFHSNKQSVSMFETIDSILYDRCIVEGKEFFKDPKKRFKKISNFLRILNEKVFSKCSEQIKNQLEPFINGKKKEFSVEGLIKFKKYMKLKANIGLFECIHQSKAYNEPSRTDQIKDSSKENEALSMAKALFSKLDSLAAYPKFMNECKMAINAKLKGEGGERNPKLIEKMNKRIDRQKESEEREKYSK